MSQAPPTTPFWVTHAGEIIAGFAFVWGVVTGVWSGVRRILRWRDHQRVLTSARDDLLTVLSDWARESLHDDASMDDGDIRDRVARRKALIDEARDRFWVAHGRKRGAPSSAEPDEDS